MSSAMSKESTRPVRHTVFVMRAGERMDRMFPQWWTDCFHTDKHGRQQYTISDLNMPVRLPRRADGTAAFQFDTPLTEFGNLQAQLIGRTLRQRSVHIEAVYCSPALRCVQSASALLAAARSAVRARLEPALADAIASHTKGTLPKYMSVDELVSYGYAVDAAYTPLMSMTKITELMESGDRPTADDDYRRVMHAANAVARYKLAERTGGGATIVVGHAHTVDAFSRTMLGHGVPKRFRATDAQWMGLHYPYGGVVQLQADERAAKGTWCWAAERPLLLSYMDQCGAVDWDYTNRP